MIAAIGRYRGAPDLAGRETSDAWLGRTVQWNIRIANSGGAERCDTTYGSAMGAVGDICQEIALHSPTDVRLCAHGNNTC